MSLIAAERKFFREHPGEVFDEGAYRREERAPVEFAVEGFREIVEEVKTLLEEHWQEIALDKEAIKLDPDWENYAWLASKGMLHIVTARDDGWLIGYHVSVIRPHTHYKGSLTCFTDIFFIKKEYRSGMTGYKLLKFFVASAKAKGVEKIYMGTKLSLDIDPLLRRLGFNAIERVYTMVFV